MDEDNGGLPRVEEFWDPAADRGGAAVNLDGGAAKACGREGPAEPAVAHNGVAKAACHWDAGERAGRLGKVS